MKPKNLRVFIDTSVLFAAILSPTGGARRLFHLAEAGVLCLVVGPSVLREADEVVRRKASSSRPVLAQLLDAGRVETSQSSQKSRLRMPSNMFDMRQMHGSWLRPSALNRIGLSPMTGSIS